MDMFAQQWTNRKKREREDDNEECPSGFGEHRTKRRIAALPHRSPPKATRSISPSFSFNTHYTSQPAPPTITPVDSDNEDTTQAAEPRSFFSYSSSPTVGTFTQSGSPSPWLETSMNSLENSQSTVASEGPTYSDDFEMTDSMHLSPGPFHNEPSGSISGRIPTPIHSSFAPFIRADKSSMHTDADFANDEAIVGMVRHARRLPSPISEGEASPSMIVAGFSDMQMEVETSHQEQGRETLIKKGHTRSKHSLRSWTGYGSDIGGTGMKRSFSMGYRADCEKCRMKVPGHFSHIITY